MDRSVPRLPTTTARLSITVRRFSITIGRSPTIPAVPAPQRLAFPAQRPGTGVLAAAIVLFATVPAQVARLALDSAVWDLTRSRAAGMPRPDLSATVLPLLLGSIVVLAVVSSSGGHHHDHW
jgi:hypothetical protein